MSDAASATKATPAVAFCFLANRLLSSERWARARLEPFHGQSFELRLPFLAPVLLSIKNQRIEPGGAAPAAIVTVGGVTGASALADELRYLAKHLRPDVAEELSRVVGDVAAERIVGSARSLARWQADTARRLVEAVADFAIEERRLFVRRAELADLAGRIEDMRRRLERLAERMDRLA